ncbi:MAG: hypothetical protein ACREHG_05840 [Candidatus Saccharimonadales bacterium]
MEIRITVDSLEELAKVAAALNGLTSTASDDWPRADAGKPAKPADERPPWEPDGEPATDGAESSTGGTDADPWDATTPASSKPAQTVSDAAVDTSDDPWE